MLARAIPHLLLVLPLVACSNGTGPGDFVLYKPAPAEVEGRLRSGTLLVTSEGLPSAYDVLPGNGKTILTQFVTTIGSQYSKAGRIWSVHRYTPTEAILPPADRSGHHLVGRVAGRLSRLG